MKKLLKFISNLLACPKCHSMGVIEKPNGDTMTCNMCNGKGIV